MRPANRCKPEDKPTKMPEAEWVFLFLRSHSPPRHSSLWIGPCLIQRARHRHCNRATTQSIRCHRLGPRPPETVHTRDAPNFRPPNFRPPKMAQKRIFGFRPKYLCQRNNTAETEICDDANKKRGQHTLIWINTNVSAVWTFFNVSEKNPRIAICKNCNVLILMKLLHSHSHKCMVLIIGIIIIFRCFGFRYSAKNFHFGASLGIKLSTIYRWTRL